MKPTCEQNWTATVGNLPLTDCLVNVQGGDAPIADLRDLMWSNRRAILFGCLAPNSVGGVRVGTLKVG
jgi:hypothetical protein